jgi:hypothetical protein
MVVPPFGQGSFIFLQSEVTATAAWLYFRFNRSHRGNGDTFYNDEVVVKIFQPGGANLSKPCRGIMLS